MDRVDLSWLIQDVNVDCFAARGFNFFESGCSAFLLLLMFVVVGSVERMDNASRELMNPVVMQFTGSNLSNPITFVVRAIVVVVNPV